MKSQTLLASRTGFYLNSRLSSPMALKGGHGTLNPLLLSVLVFELWHPLGFDGLDTGRPSNSLGLVFEPEGFGSLSNLPLLRRLRLLLVLIRTIEI